MLKVSVAKVAMVGLYLGMMYRCTGDYERTEIVTLRWPVPSNKLLCADTINLIF